MFDANFQGMEALKQKAASFTEAVRQKILVSSVRKGAQLIVKKARENVAALDDPETGRKIGKNIGTAYRTRQSQREDAVVIATGVRYPRGKMVEGNKDDGVQTPHWHLLELGSEHSKATPFLVPAALEVQAQIPQAIANEMTKLIDKELGKS